MNDILILDTHADFDPRNKRVLNLNSVKHRNQIFDRKNRSFIINRTNSVDLTSKSIISKDRTVH